MSLKVSEMKKVKSARRQHIIDDIMDALRSRQVFDTIDYKHKGEGWIKQYMHRPLIDKLVETHQWLTPNVSAVRIRKKAEHSLLWEGDVNTTVNNFLFLGVQHRPDFIIQIDGLRIAVEVKRGDSGAGIREGIGQAVVYSTEFDFVCYLFVDVSKDKKVKRSLENEKEQFMVNRLWEHYNICFDVV